MFDDDDRNESDTAVGSFANAEWAVLEDGLEHRATGYFIAGPMLGARRRDGLWEWPLHLSEKSWCNPRLFREAFLAALDRFGFEHDDRLTRSFAVGFGRTSASGAGARDGFVPLGELVRPKPVARKRPAPAEVRVTSRARPLHRESVVAAHSGG